MRCPTCSQPVPQGRSKYRPFCSERCKLLDLSRWLDGSYAIPGEPASDEDLTLDLQSGDDATSPRPARRSTQGE